MVLLADSGWATILVLVALGLVIGWVLLRTHRYLGRQRREDAPLVRLPRSQEGRPAHHADAPADVLRWEVQMHETARELSAELDSKMGALQALIAEADRAAARLEAAAAEASGARPRTESEQPPTTQAEALRAGGRSAGTTGGGRASQAASARPRREEIYTLADYGLGAAEIARRVGSPVGEVELILGLREKE